MLRVGVRQLRGSIAFGSLSLAQGALATPRWGVAAVAHVEGQPACKDKLALMFIDVQ